jgi:ATP-dependent exoDNAse (exonuclease V) alpha subunit
MVDHQRMDALTELVERSGAKLIAVGDGKQLPSIGPGGMFDRLAEHAPFVELGTIHRTRDPAEQRAWQALRVGEPERAMAHYKARGRLHLTDTRDQAAENAVQAWAQLTEQHDIREVALIADASNTAIDRLNARAQHLRAERGELGERELQLASVNYGLREGDHVAFIAQHRTRGQARIENGTRGQITRIGQDGTLDVTIDGSGRQVQLAGEDIESLRLAYAHHVYRQQGATVDRAVVLTGGWQTSKETAYVEATRARHGTDWYIARDQLGEEGQDPERIDRLAQRMSNSRLHTPSVAYDEQHDPAWQPGRDPLRLGRLLPRPDWLDRKPERAIDVDRGR